MINPSEIRRLELGHYTMPPASRLPGQKIVVCAYLVPYAHGLLLFDTGIGSGHPSVDDEFGPIHRKPLVLALETVGVRPADVTAVANCHLHLDHCGNNPLFPQIPIYVQKSELEAVSSLDYFMPELIDFEGVRLEVAEGEADVAPGLRILPTPGHTPGHQSVLVETSNGRILLAGQAMDDASDFARAEYSLRVGDGQQARSVTDPPAWLTVLDRLDIQQVMFAHDLLVWDRSTAFR